MRDNLTLLFLPPCSLDFSSKGWVFQFLKANDSSNRVHANVGALEAGREPGWKWLRRNASPGLLEDAPSMGRSSASGESSRLLIQGWIGIRRSNA